MGNHNPKLQFARIFKQKREELEFSQNDLANRMDVPQSTIARIENGEVAVTSTTLMKFLNATGLNIRLRKKREAKKKKLFQADVFQVVNHVLKCANKILGTDYDITNMKLNKLLYYIQLYSIGSFGSRMIKQDLEAWEHGPIFREVYYRFKNRRNQIIPPNESLVKEDILPIEYKELINKIVGEFGKLSAFELRNKTHMESPWLKAFNSEGGVIKDDDLKKWYEHILIFTNRYM